MTFKCVANGVYKLHAGTQGWQELKGFTAVELGRVFNPRVLQIPYSLTAQIT